MRSVCPVQDLISSHFNPVCTAEAPSVYQILRRVVTYDTIVSTIVVPFPVAPARWVRQIQHRGYIDLTDKVTFAAMSILVLKGLADYLAFRCL